jgi:hypothetical protein
MGLFSSSRIMTRLDRDAIALNRTYQGRVCVMLWMLPLVERDWHGLDVQVGLDDRIVGEISEPVTICPAVAKFAQDDRDVDVAIGARLSPRTTAEQHEPNQRVPVGSSRGPSEQIERPPERGRQSFGQVAGIVEATM